MKRFVAIASLLVLLSSISSAWGPVGHMLVAAVAWKQMKPSTRREISRIFRFGDEVAGNFGGQFDHIDYVKIDPETASDEEIEKRVGPAFIQAATWADDVKPDHNGNRAQHVAHESVPNPDFADLIKTLNGHLTASEPGENSDLKAWHFVDYPLHFNRSREVLIDTSSHHPIDKSGPKPTAHALNALRLEVQPNIKKLAPNSTSDPHDTAVYVYLLEHIVGDLHQPLHCATVYSTSFAPNPHDRGGNSFKLSTSKSSLEGLAFVAKDNLHSLWDGGPNNAILMDASLGITEPGKMSYDQILHVADAWIQSSAPSVAKANSLNPQSWAKDSEKLAVSSAYKGLKQHSKVTATYAKRNVDLCRHQIVLGGFRLAKLLDSELN